MTDAQIQALRAVAAREEADGRSVNALIRKGLVIQGARGPKLTEKGRRVLKNLKG